MSGAERIAALGARGISLYLAADGSLRVTAEPSEAHVLDAVLPSIRAHKLEIVGVLVAWERAHLARARLASRESA